MGRLDGWTITLFAWAVVAKMASAATAPRRLRCDALVFLEGYMAAAWQINSYVAVKMVGRWTESDAGYRQFAMVYILKYCMQRKWNALYDVVNSCLSWVGSWGPMNYEIRITL
jgi:hypothetical protein